ncbi:hypothetical protein AAFC00_001153 [Neodothiora populina]|uniref:C2H2-type domain-containing protein n=1 Tax=Neodothiora populina TaxID=2781224 RepID=A0ABR3PNZ0_9PEZI
MLSTNTTSSIQRRRQLHRRQNSLEVPTLAAPISANSRRPQGYHRRGLSLDQSTNQPFQLQDQEQPIVSMTTNTGRPTSQHSMQAQLHIPTQPGPQMDPQQLQNYYNQQQFLQAQFVQNQSMANDAAAREQALQQLNQHMQTFMQRFGPVHENIVSQPRPQLAQFPQHSSQSATVVQRPFTPINNYIPPAPSSAPPRRAERVVDVASMPNFTNVPLLQIQETSPEAPHMLQESFGSEYGYPSSYASSMVDPSSPMRSPIRQNSSAGLPTLYEGISPVSSHGGFGADLLLSAASGTPDLRYMTDSPMRVPMSPREMMIANLDIDASIEDTGISAEEVQQYISEQDPTDGKWTCLFDGCYKKFGRKENIKSHVQTHLGDRQFKCNHCGKCFVRQHDLKRHAKIHSGDKPHKCPCGNGFARQDALTRHRQRGVCDGALPGFERREVKRGRPRKMRPELTDRLEKANRARMLDARRGSELPGYESSSSSDRDYPDTPPSANLEEDPFSANFTSFMKPFEETPPTSPVVSSPTKSGNKTTMGDFWSLDTEQQEVVAESVQRQSSPRSSPPPATHSPVLGVQATANDFNSSVFDFGPLDAQPKVAEQAFDAFSPAQSSSQGSDDHHTPEAHFGAETFMGADAILDFNNGMYGPAEALFTTATDSWEWTV